MTFRKFAARAADSDFFSIFTDFTKYAAADWVITTTEAGSGAASEALDADGVGGRLVVTNDDADNDKDFFQYSADGGTTPLEAFKFTSGKRLQFVFKGQLSDAADSDFFAGLYVTDTDPVGGLTDGIYFRKLDGDNTLQLVVEKDSTETAVDVGELADATEFELEFYYDGSSNRIEAFLNGSRTASAVLTNVPDDEELAMSFGCQNGEAAAKVLTVDYIGALQERS